MKFNTYDVTLTNGTVQHTYRKHAFTEEQATILAQAETIYMGRGYQLVSITLIKE
jgi:hypothetical protein